MSREMNPKNNKGLQAHLESTTDFNKSSTSSARHMLVSTMFAMETPSRVWKRVQDLQKQEELLDDLPSLPADSSAEDDLSAANQQSSYVQPSPKQRILLDSPVTSQQRRAADSSFKKVSIESPLHSTPSQHAPSTVSSMRTGQTTLRPAGPSRSGSLRSLPSSRKSSFVRSRSQSRSNVDLSIEQTEQSIDQASSVDEDMKIVQSGSSSDEGMKGQRKVSGRSQPNEASMEDVSLQSPRIDDLSAQLGTLPSAENSYANSQHSPCPQPAYRRPSPIPEDSEAAGSEKASPASIASTSSRRPDLHHVVLDRKKRSTGTRDRVPSLTHSYATSRSGTILSPESHFSQHDQVSINQSNDEPSRDSADQTDLPPLSRRSSPAKQYQSPYSKNRTLESSPGVARDHPSSAALSRQHETPLSRTLASFVSSKFANLNRSASSDGLRHASPSQLATPKPQGSQSDIDRRKNHLLATLQMTAVRSETRARIKKGTPFRREETTTGSESGSSASASFLGSVSDATSNDLNPTANNSLPLAGQAARFNGAKLNSYLHTLNTHLTSENSNLVKSLEESNAEIARLQNLLGDQSGSEGEMSRMMAEERERETDRLKSNLNEKEEELAELRGKLLKAHTEWLNQGEETRALGQEKSVNELQARVFELQDALKAEEEARKKEVDRVEELEKELDEKDRVIEDARAELEEQEADFAEKMKKLEEELCAVMEEQEGQLDEAQKEPQAKSELLQQHQEDWQHEREGLQNEIVQLEEDLQQTTEQRDRLAADLEQVSASAASKRSTSPTDRNDAKVSSLMTDLAAKESLLKAVNAENVRLSERVSALKKQATEHAEELVSLKSQYAQITQDRQSDANDRNQDIDDLQSEIQMLAGKIEGFEQREANLLVQLDTAQRDLDQHVILGGPALDDQSMADAKDLEIDHLVKAKAALEVRVSGLKDQVALLSLARQSDMMTPSKSIAFKPIVGIATPKTPGQFLNDMTYLDQSDATLTPYDVQVQKLEVQIRRLHDQLAAANNELDDKLAKLQAANRGNLVTGKELIAARARIVQLENQRVGGRSSPSGSHQDLAAAKNEATKLEAELTSARHQIQRLIRQQHNAPDTSAQSGELEKLLRAKSAELRDVQQQLREVRADREDVLSGVNGLFADLQRVRQDTVELGCDIASARQGGCAPNNKGRVAEVKGLFAIVAYLKQKYTRESNLRGDLAHQKLYLQMLLQQKQSMIDATATTLTRFGLPSSLFETPKVTSRKFKSAVLAVMALSRMSTSSRKWRAQLEVKTALREAYGVARGKPFPI